MYSAATKVCWNNFCRVFAQAVFSWCIAQGGTATIEFCAALRRSEALLGVTSIAGAWVSVLLTFSRFMCCLAIEGNIFFFVVDCAMEAAQMLHFSVVAGQFLEDLVLAGIFLDTVGCMILLFYTLVNLVSGWQGGVTVNTKSRLHPRYKQEGGHEDQEGRRNGGA